MNKLFLILMLLLICPLTYAQWQGVPGGGTTIVEQSDCSTILSGFCVDTDDGVLYYWDGDSVENSGATVSTASPIGDTAFDDLDDGSNYDKISGSSGDDTINELFAALEAKANWKVTSTTALTALPITDLTDNDIAFVIATGQDLSIYIYDSDGTSAASSPEILRPDDYVTQGNWLLEWPVTSATITPIIITDADGITLTADQMNSVIVMTGAGDVDIPADQCDTATGKYIIVKSTAAHLNSITSNDASDQFVLHDGTALTAGNELDLAGAAGSQVCVMCLQANKLWVTGYIGTPVDGGAAD